MEEIILKYLEKKPLSQKEKYQLNQWLEKSEDNRIYFSNLSNHWDLTEIDLSMAQYRVHQKIFEKQKILPNNHSKKSYLLRIAAAVVLVLCSIVLLLKFGELKIRDANKEVAIAKAIVKKANPGEKLTIKLPDGSTVKLNSGSEIIYLEHFEENERIVEMHGEAFFDVVPDTTRPFIIQSTNMIVKVVGTSFNVKAYPDEQRKSVAVKSGVVQVNDLTNTFQTVLKKKQQISICEKDQLFKKEQIRDEDMVFGWTENNLTLYDLSLSETLRKISKWYGVNFEIKNGFKTETKVTARFNNPTLKTVMTSISHTYGFEYELNNGNIIIK